MTQQQTPAGYGCLGLVVLILAALALLKYLGC